MLAANDCIFNEKQETQFVSGDRKRHQKKETELFGSFSHA